MAYTKAPTQDTYSQHTIPVVYDVSPTAGLGQLNFIDSCSGLTNLLVTEIKIGDEKQQVAVSRPNLNMAAVDSGNTTGLVQRGLYVWRKTTTVTYFYAVFGTKVYTSADASTWTLRHTLTTNATTPVGFTEFIDSATNTKTLVMVDGVQGFTFATDAAGTEIVDAQFPTPHLPFPVYLDGYLFLAKTNTGDIYNSDLNNEESWTAGNFISSELYPDDLQAIAKIDNFLLAIGIQGSEYFYDAANATSSPLKRVDGASLPFGTTHPYTIACDKNTLVMLACTNDGGASFVHIEGQNHKFFNNTVLEAKLWGNAQTTYNFDALWGFFLRFGPSLYYGISVLGKTANPHSSLPSRGKTWVYDMERDLWIEWTYNSGSSTASQSVQGAMPITRSCSGAPGGTHFSTSMWVGGNVENVPMVGTIFFDNLGLGGNNRTSQDICDGATTTYTPIYWEVRTSPLTFGTLNKKTMSRFGINMCYELSYTFSVEWSDFEYDEWATARTRTLPSSNTADPFPFVEQLGSFRKRKLKVSNNTNTQRKSVILYSFECDINKGIQ